MTGYLPEHSPEEEWSIVSESDLLVEIVLE
jgi:hypothetical protein